MEEIKFPYRITLNFRREDKEPLKMLEEDPLIKEYGFSKSRVIMHILKKHYEEQNNGK